MRSPSTPFPWKGERPKGKGLASQSTGSADSIAVFHFSTTFLKAQATSGATRHLLPKEGGRSGMRSPSIPFPWKGNARRTRGWSRKAWEVLIQSQHFILAVLP